MGKWFPSCSIFWTKWVEKNPPSRRALLSFFVFTDVLGRNFNEWFHVVQRWRKQAYREQNRKQKKHLVTFSVDLFFTLETQQTTQQQCYHSKGDEHGAWWFLVAGPCETKKPLDRGDKVKEFCLMVPWMETLPLSTRWEQKPVTKRGEITPLTVKKAQLPIYKGHL